MAGLNKVFLIGNLTRDPELRYTPSGLAVTTFTVAANRSYTTPSGEKKDATTFMRTVAWGKRAEVCGEYLNKGSLVFVEGRIQNRNWQAQDGTKRTTVEIVANNVQFLGSPRRTAAPSKHPAEEAQRPLNAAPDVDIPPEQTEGSRKSHEDEVPF